jgi:hypothetical protein
MGIGMGEGSEGANECNDAIIGPNIAWPKYSLVSAIQVSDTSK